MLFLITSRHHHGPRPRLYLPTANHVERVAIAHQIRSPPHFSRSRTHLSLIATIPSRLTPYRVRCSLAHPRIAWRGRILPCLCRGFRACVVLGRLDVPTWARYQRYDEDILQSLGEFEWDGGANLHGTRRLIKYQRGRRGRVAAFRRGLTQVTCAAPITHMAPPTSAPPSLLRQLQTRLE